MVVSLTASLISGPISDRIGKRKLPVFVSSTIIAIGIAVPWVLKSQFSMFVYAALMGLGYGIYMVVDQALNVDVLPNPNEAGKALGILNLANTLGQVIAPIVVSSIVVATGGYFLVFPIAIAAVTIGAVADRRTTHSQARKGRSFPRVSISPPVFRKGTALRHGKPRSWHRSVGGSAVP